jgi:holo-[acyl-carrier protein] synthase
MIIGVGTDLCDIRRIEKTLARFPGRFVERVFTETEQEKAARRANPASAYALCYAAKEACSKALGTGFRDGVFWRDLGVENLPSGQPVMRLTNGARQRLEGLVPDGMVAKVDVSLTDEYPMAHAIVIISGLPVPDDA